ncbi:flagellar motor switch protein FliG [Sandaracinobacteroides hominis]|uniref:flagellar motor switch protein FliG n=1 Tax=Sandaracinobacteroides hominis TaxID=2780086 RepID=UPI0018F36625|nr:FliG C-terminal domain-containing protein [Sandaracinobacteroides hominis]
MLNGAEKTALMLLLLEEPEAAGLLARLEPGEVETVGRAMLSVAEATPETIDCLLDEVLSIARETVPVGDGPPTTRDLLVRSLGDERAGGIIERLGEEARPPLFERMRWLEPYALASLLEGEHPQAQAFVLAQLPSARAAQVLARLPIARQPDLVRRVATIGAVTPHSAEALDFSLSDRITAARPRQPITDHGGMRRAADLITLSGIDAEAALEALSQVDPTAASVLSETMFTFADLARLDPRGLQTLVRSLDAELLVPALRAAPDELAAKLLAAMPQRAAEALKDEMDSRGPVKLDEALNAQKQIAAAARQLGADGTISLPGKGGGFV